MTAMQEKMIKWLTARWNDLPREFFHDREMYEAILDLIERSTVSLQSAIYALDEMNACRWMADDFLEWLAEAGVEVIE